MKSQLRRADRSGAALALIRGQAEAEAGEVLVKDLRGEAQQYALALDQVPTLLCELTIAKARERIQRGLR